MTNHLTLQFIMLATSIYLGWMFYGDWKKSLQGETTKGALPGATTCPRPLLWLGVGCGIALCAIATWGELLLGTVDEQSTIPFFYLLPMLAAGLVEEVVFRGFLVVRQRGPAVLLGSILFFSILFSLAHFQYYTAISENDNLLGLEWRWTPQSRWTLFTLFLNSLVFYLLRFHPQNHHRSLLPCICAHASYNLAVFLMKLHTGFVSGWF